MREAIRTRTAPGELRRRGVARMRSGWHRRPKSRAGSAPRPDTAAAARRLARAGFLSRLQAFGRAYLTLRRQLSDPLSRNGYALMANTAVTGLLGVAYWLLAARHYAAADVGRAAAAYSAMNLLSGFTALNLVGALTRFIPQSGHRTAGLVLRAYAFSSLASVLVTAPFLVAISHLGSSYTELSGVSAGLVFTACIACWGIFTLQDGVLVGLRSAVWVPVENGTFGIAKIVLLLALATSLPHAGIYVSWILPVAISLPLVNALIFGRLMQPHSRLTAARTPPSARQIGQFLVGDYAGALCVLAVYYLVPIAVAARIGPSVNAYFYMAWMVGGVLDLFAVNMATSLTVEGAFDEATLAANCRAALRRTMLILVPIAAGVAFGSPVALGLFGSPYAAHGARILELLAVATLPKALTELYLGTLRAQSRTSMIALIQGIRAVLILGLAFALTGIMGMAGAGVAVLASQLVVAAVVAPGLLSLLWRRPPQSARPILAALPGRHLNVILSPIARRAACLGRSTVTLGEHAGVLRRSAKDLMTQRERTALRTLVTRRCDAALSFAGVPGPLPDRCRRGPDSPEAPDGLLAPARPFGPAR